MRRIIVVALALSAVVPAGAEATPIASADQVDCPKLYSVVHANRLVRAVYKRDEVSRGAQRRVGHLRRCQISGAPARKRVRATVRKHRAAYKRRKREAARTPPVAGLPDCTWVGESGGDYGALNPSSGAGGKYQFLPSTWAGLGGKGLPHLAPPAEQERLAAKLYAQQGLRSVGELLGVLTAA